MIHAGPGLGRGSPMTSLGSTMTKRGCDTRRRNGIGGSKLMERRQNRRGERSLRYPVKSMLGERPSEVNRCAWRHRRSRLRASRGQRPRRDRQEVGQPCSKFCGALRCATHPREHWRRSDTPCRWPDHAGAGPDASAVLSAVLGALWCSNARRATRATTRRSILPRLWRCAG